MSGKPGNSSDQSLTALQRAVGFLSRREHSQSELRWKLVSRDYGEDEIQAALDRLLEQGLQSDERFAEAYVQSRFQRGHGPYKIALELGQRGVEESLAEQVIYSGEFDWFEHACQVYSKKFSGKPENDFRDRAKRSRFLQQRGFSSEQIQFALDSQ